MSANDNLSNVMGQSGGSGDCGPEFRDPRTTLGVEEMVSEEEARRRREQLNRRPSYRMILKDLETVGDKPLKKEMDENHAHAEQQANGAVVQSSSNALQQLPDSSTDSSNYAASSALIVNLQKSPDRGGPILSSGLGIVSASAPITHLSPPAQAHINLGQLNLIAPSASSQQPQSRLIAEIPSQPQPQIQPVNAVAPPQPLLTAVNNLEMLGLKAPENISPAFSQSEWQNNLINSYNRQQQQLQQQQLLQNPSNSALNNITGTVGPPQQQQQPGPPHGMGTRQGSASLTSFTSNRSDNDETSRKRQVRLLKNREAAKECRRKKKEYVKCLENRVAVLENQNKALIEELKTLKELYCRKEKGDMQ